MLTSKVGQAHVRTHHYPRVSLLRSKGVHCLSVQLVPPPSLLVPKAINYYETALKSHANEAGLRCELAQLYLKLTYYDKAKKTLVAGLRIGEGGKW